MEDRPKTPRSDNIGQSHLNKDPILNKKYFSKYKAIKKLGEGSFGKVYKAVYKGEYYALKFESHSDGQNLLEGEATIMSYLKGPNIPLIKSFGFSGDYNILVMQLLGQSLEDIFNKREKFSIKTTAMLGYQILNVLQFIHDKHIIHRDIKPDNFVMGLNEYNAILYLLDFGLAKKYRSSKTLVQYPYIKKKKLTGTARYASIHALEEMEQSRRDDLESAGYVLMYFIRGNLPWQGLKIKTKDNRYQKILDKKKATTSEELCANFPIEFKQYIDYTRNLGYSENPDYEKLRKNFINVVKKTLRENFDFIYDWTTKGDIKKRQNIDDIINISEINKVNDNPKDKSSISSDNKSNDENSDKDEKNKEKEKNTNKNKKDEDEDEKSNKKKKEEDDDDDDENNNGKVESKCCLM
jgi:serine/threonine protein kinase